MTPCLKCGDQARWQDDRGRAWCSSHLPNSGQFWSVQDPKTVVFPDIADRLDQCVSGWFDANADICREAAAEIRRLRALVRTETKQEGKR